MPRKPTILSQVVFGFMTLVFAVVVGHPFGPQHSARPPSTSVVCCAELNASEDTFRVGERLEPRVLKAPILAR